LPEFAILGIDIADKMIYIVSVASIQTKENRMSANKMKIYRISQEENNEQGAFESAIVVAPNEKAARFMNPADGKPMSNAQWGKGLFWCTAPKNVKVEFVGIATGAYQEQGVVCVSRVER